MLALTRTLTRTQPRYRVTNAYTPADNRVPVSSLSLSLSLSTCVSSSMEMGLRKCQVIVSPSRLRLIGPAQASVMQASINQIREKEYRRREPATATKHEREESQSLSFVYDRVVSRVRRSAEEESKDGIKTENSFRRRLSLKSRERSCA